MKQHMGYALSDNFNVDATILRRLKISAPLISSMRTEATYTVSLCRDSRHHPSSSRDRPTPMAIKGKSKEQRPLSTWDCATPTSPRVSVPHANNPEPAANGEKARQYVGGDFN